MIVNEDANETIEGIMRDKTLTIRQKLLNVTKYRNTLTRRMRRPLFDVHTIMETFEDEKSKHLYFEVMPDEVYRMTIHDAKTVDTMVYAGVTYRMYYFKSNDKERCFKLSGERANSMDRILADCGFVPGKTQVKLMWTFLGDENQGIAYVVESFNEDSLGIMPDMESPQDYPDWLC